MILWALFDCSLSNVREVRASDLFPFSVSTESRALRLRG